jgi:hypothetical protein
VSPFAGDRVYLSLTTASSSFYGNQINIYDFKKSRNASTLIQFLEDFNGTVVCDDYAGYDTLRKQNKNKFLFAHEGRI